MYQYDYDMYVEQDHEKRRSRKNFAGPTYYSSTKMQDDLENDFVNPAS